MGQYWTLKNIDRHETVGGGKLREWLFYADHHRLLEQLASPVQLPRSYDKWLNGGKRVTQGCPLMKLPDELLDMIFKELDVEDMSLFCFAITCKDLLALAKQPILKAIDRVIPTWANCRLICLGEYADDIDDLPAGMLTTEERARIDAAVAAESDDRYLNVETMFELVEEPFELKLRGAITSMTRKITKNTARRGGALQRKSERCLREVDMLCAFLSLHEQPRPIPDVLCNISKGEYVRRAALPDITFDHGGNVTLAHALIVQVLWSSDPTCNFDIPEKYVERIMRGPWAGDRFCVTARKNMPQLASGIGEWRDVSDEVVKFLSIFVRDFASE
ncbi:hypothetical protein C8Q73DRAFT_75141 [Cubamyces lactineus]|nr:hypothetical protein C8Q73DRAFT_75141 [Cubamyces lactineus]